MAWLLEPFSVTFMQRALVAVVALAVIGGVLGAWIVLRRLAFFSHAVGTATFPGLVLAGPVGLAPPLAALTSGAGFAMLAARLARPGGGLGPDAVVGLLLVGSLALGAVLASDVFSSGTGVDRLLFGTLLGLSGTDLAVAGGVALATCAAALILGRTWLATGFDPAAARALGVPATRGDRALLVALAAAAVAMLPAVGALLVATLLAVPAATARLLARSLRGLVAGAVAAALVDGIAGLWLAYRLDLPPGPAIAVVGGLVFALAAASAAFGRRGTATA